MRDVLEECGYQVLEAADCLETLNVWKANASQIDLLVVDMAMPGGMDGRELADKLRREQPNLKVIFMSGFVLDAAEPPYSSPCFLQKPFTPENLTDLVKSYLGSARA